MRPLAHVAAENPPAEQERQLVAEVLRKDRKATAEFVSRCADWIYPFIFHRLLPHTEMMEDLMREILLAAWNSLPSFRGDGGLQAWVVGIARHKVEDYYRKCIREALPQEDGEEPIEPIMLPVLEEEIDAVAQQEQIQQTLAGLPEPYRLALLWRYQDEKSVREMATLVGKTEKAMERLLPRARQNSERGGAMTSPSEDREFRHLLSAPLQSSGRAPSSLKARLYSALIREQQASGPLASLGETVAATHGICVFEKLVQIAPIGEKAKSPFFCTTCHARVLAEHFDNPPIFWPNCPYVAFKKS